MLSHVLAALYCKSDSRASTRVSRHAQVLGSLRRRIDGEGQPEWQEIIDILRSESFASEAMYLSDRQNFERGEHLIDTGQVITIACECYPKMLQANLGVAAPPVLWISHPEMRVRPPWMNEDGSQRVTIGGIGCRAPLGIGLAISQLVGDWVARQGVLGVSGGASGCDEGFGNAIVDRGGEVVHILPHGLDRLGKNLSGYLISVAHPEEPFSAARAMERNSLIYAFGLSTIVCSARYRLGGSWQGAVSAIKAHRPVVVADWTSTGFAETNPEAASGTYALAQKALANLGAFPMLLDLANFRTQIDDCMASALDWSLEKYAGQIDSGLFA